ncbi:MAG TPA: serine hydrolase domain-containing protein [Gemmatimonadaceae bacterium]|nr:serine hydrolase domain-containing protein [Gemmatimonadaceae bacterium]
MRRSLLPALAVLFFVAASATAQRITDPRVRTIDSVMTAAEAGGYSGTILVRQRGAVLLNKAYGFADREANKRMTLETGIEIGSITKPITLTALLRLQEMGKLSLADSLGAHFPETPPDKRGITLELIARHRAGFPDTFGSDYDPVSREWIVQKVLSAPLLYTPGDTNRYSNSGYSVLAAIVEKRSGMPYEAFVREEVLRRAGTLRIGYRLPGWKTTDLAVGYRADGSRWGTPLDYTWLPDGPGWNLRGNGGMFATTRELADWYQALFDGKILGKEALAKFYAIAAGQSRTVGGLALAHAGGNGIFNALHVSWIDADTHLTIFSSVANHQAERVWERFREPLIAIGKEGHGTTGAQR